LAGRAGYRYTRARQKGSGNLSIYPSIHDTPPTYTIQCWAPAFLSKTNQLSWFDIYQYWIVVLVSHSTTWCIFRSFFLRDTLRILRTTHLHPFLFLQLPLLDSFLNHNSFILYPCNNVFVVSGYIFAFGIRDASSQ